ncbi:CYTH domain-containing protein [Candidatus Hodarchaeum mangrovi]
MSHINIEFKAKCPNSKKHEEIRHYLEMKGAEFKGIDHQRDIYFKVRKGRLKLRRGNIESSLIYYERENIKDPKSSNIILYHVDKSSQDTLEKLLLKIFDVLVVVEKKRAIYFLENVKFHIDSVNNLGLFIEVEAIDIDGSLGVEKIREQCDQYLELFNIDPSNLIKVSYSDLLLAKDSINLHE